MVEESGAVRLFRIRGGDWSRPVKAPDANSLSFFYSVYPAMAILIVSTMPIVIKILCVKTAEKRRSTILELPVHSMI
jgi:hypothetical protein